LERVLIGIAGDDVSWRNEEMAWPTLTGRYTLIEGVRENDQYEASESGRIATGESYNGL
jgi:hypothetical protein